MKFCVLASGSSGNCTFISDGKTRIIIDCGLSIKELRKRLDSIGERLEKIDAIIVTHSHNDHSKGLPLLANRHEFPAVQWMTKGTESVIGWNGRGKPDRLEYFAAGGKFQVGTMEITSFTVPHDDPDPVAYVITASGVRCAVVTDLGYMPPAGIAALRPCEVICLEFNHDPEMLAIGPYPDVVKRRIASKSGHLSNLQACKFIEEELQSNTQILIGAHLSTENNNPELVRVMAEQALHKRNMSPELALAFQDIPTKVWTL